MRSKSWKHAIIVMALSAAVIAGGQLIRAFAQSSDSESTDSKKAFRRIESITLDPQNCKLAWTVTRGEVHNGEYSAKGKPETYEISFHTAEMTHKGVTYKFSVEEAVRVHQVLQAISRYAAESVDWYEQQQAPVSRAAR